MIGMGVDGGGVGKFGEGRETGAVVAGVRVGVEWRARRRRHRRRKRNDR